MWPAALPKGSLHLGWPAAHADMPPRWQNKQRGTAAPSTPVDITCAHWDALVQRASAACTGGSKEAADLAALVAECGAAATWAHQARALRGITATLGAQGGGDLVPAPLQIALATTIAQLIGLPHKVQSLRQAAKSCAASFSTKLRARCPTTRAAAHLLPCVLCRGREAAAGGCSAPAHAAAARPHSSNAATRVGVFPPGGVLTGAAAVLRLAARQSAWWHASRRRFGTWRHFAAKWPAPGSNSSRQVARRCRQHALVLLRRSSRCSPLHYHSYLFIPPPQPQPHLLSHPTPEQSMGCSRQRAAYCATYKYMAK